MTYRIELYEIIGEGGRYFFATRRASTKEKALASLREVYPSHIYRLASITELP